MRWFVSLIMMGTLLTLFHPTAAAPPPQNTVSFGESVTGEITASQYRQQYLFSGRAGQIINIEMRVSEGELDPYLLLIDTNGDIVDVNDDDMENLEVATRNAALRLVTLPQQGTYTIVATRYGQAHGTTTGTFELSLELLSETIAVTGSASILQYGDEVVGQINDSQARVVYVLQANRGDVINISLSRVSGDLDPLLDLFDPNQQFLINGDDDESAPGTLNARIVNYVIPADGFYYIQATRYGRELGVTTGTFTLQVDEIPDEQLGTRPGNARILDIGELAQATISEEVPTHFFRFEARRGDIVSAIATRVSDDLEPRVSILRTDLSPLGVAAATSDEAIAELPGVTILVDGIYLAVVTRAGGVGGETLGSFSLQVSTRPGISLNGALEIVYDGSVSGAIGNDDFADNFVFSGAEGDVIRITMQTAEGDLDPLLTLLNEDDKQLISDDDSLTENGRDALIDEFTLPGDGRYIIEASRFERIGGDTTGRYILNLTLLEAAEPEDIEN